MIVVLLFLLCLICCVNRLCQLITATRIPLFYKVFKTAIDRSFTDDHLDKSGIGNLLQFWINII